VSPGQSSSGERSPVLTPQVFNDPFLNGQVSSESESSPGLTKVQLYSFFFNLLYNIQHLMFIFNPFRTAE
jgi:hypothetical protein